ncbi:hypothetical protein OGAPHI_002826 [Ogataea philodendri]|uniref:Transcription factor n=1 Tax=Ogataea philodendri TaxID=1378263 RepID=A0A9P8P8E9_9ASCO|nr:uncharacterized protein OGAPHI_002826 [Ogataea philodendri]KAH3667177.1 hypothetical protein OGAPHI_002826 [Ogataea philodendri]
MSLEDMADFKLETEPFGVSEVPSPPTKDVSVPKSSGTDFVKKLFQMLEENSYSDIVRWSDTGDSFIIADTNEFTKQVLPKHFKHSNFASFVRQLNKYDFHKVKISNELKQRYSIENVWEFKHPEFQRNNRDALENIKRKVTTKKDGDVSNASSNTVSISQFRNLQDNFGFLEKQNQSLTETVQKLHDDLNILNTKYNTMVSSFLTSKSINESYSRSISIIAKSLSQIGVDLPPLNLPFADQQSQTQNPHANGPVQTSVEPAQDSHQFISPPEASKVPQPQQQQPQQDNRIVRRPPGSGMHVLLVEDDDVCIQLCSKFLMKYGCTVEVVTDGLAAINVLEKVKFDLVLMDIVMPNLDGASATSVIRSFDMDTPIIAMTGNYQHQDLVTYLNHGMTDILAKPFTKHDLYMILEKHQIDKKLIYPVSDPFNPMNKTGNSQETPGQQQVVGSMSLENDSLQQKLDSEFQNSLKRQKLA